MVVMVIVLLVMFVVSVVMRIVVLIIVLILMFIVFWTIISLVPTTTSRSSRQLSIIQQHHTVQRRVQRQTVRDGSECGVDIDHQIDLQALLGEEQLVNNNKTSTQLLIKLIFSMYSLPA